MISIFSNLFISFKLLTEIIQKMLCWCTYQPKLSSVLKKVIINLDFVNIAGYFQNKPSCLRDQTRYLAQHKSLLWERFLKKIIPCIKISKGVFGKSLYRNIYKSYGHTVVLNLWLKPEIFPEPVQFGTEYFYTFLSTEYIFPKREGIYGCSFPFCPLSSPTGWLKLERT